MAKADSQELIKKVKESVNGYFSTPEIQYNLNMRFTVPRARCWVIHLSRFILNRRDCWALAMGQAPFDVKKEIWRHEQDELISDPRAGGLDHYTLRVQGAEELWGVTRAEIESAELHPFVAAAFEAWLHLAKRSWLESFSSVSVAEMINSDAIVSGGGHSSRNRQKLMSELGIRQERLKSDNVHVEADQDHALIFDRVVAKYVTNEGEWNLVLEAAKRSLVLARAFYGGLAFAMQQIPLDEKESAA